MATIIIIINSNLLFISKINISIAKPRRKGNKYKYTSWQKGMKLNFV